MKINIKKFVIIYIVISSIAIQAQESSWYAQSSGLLDPVLESVCVLDQNTAWVSGYLIGSTSSPLILYTHDGGVTWVQQNTPGSGSIASIDFIDASTGWAVTTDGMILHTNNGGVSWAVQPFEGSDEATFASVCFVDDNNGWIVGHYPYQGDENIIIILHTSDGGVHWTLQSDQTQGMLNSVHFVDENHGWIVGYHSILRTTDGGLNWSEQMFEEIESFRSVTAVDSNSVWVIGYSNSLFKSSNGGIDWDIRTDLGGEDIYFINENEGWIVGSSIWHTVDAGTSWTEFQLTGVLGSIHFANDTSGWAVGQNFIYKYRSEIGQHTSLHASTIPHDHRLLQNYPNPFNPTTTIEFELPFTDNINLVVYNIRGERIRNLMNTQLEAGIYQFEWEGLNDFGEKVPSGVYLYHLNTPNFSQTRKMVLLE